LKPDSLRDPRAQISVAKHIVEISKTHTNLSFGRLKMVAKILLI
jgi:hypothetical protein